MEKFEPVINELRVLAAKWEPRLRSLPEGILKERKNSQNRTIKQILGHLVDSTSNNIHRIIHLQYQLSPFSFPNYASEGNNDRWIAIQDFQNEDWSDLVDLWKSLVLHICHVIGNIDSSKLKNEWIAGPGRYISLEDLIIDFLRHFRLHLSEIDELTE
jgi:hypothetical protein